MKPTLLIPHINVQNANALSSPYTIGFPAITAFLGAVHALQRMLNTGSSASAKFKSAAIICHNMDLQTYKGASDFVYSIIGTGNPLVPDDKAKNKWEAPFKRPSFIEEARCHLDISLVIEYDGIEVDDEDDVIKEITAVLNGKMKLAGGDIIGFDSPKFFKIDDTETFKKLTRKLMPGYVIVERRDLMEKSMNAGCDAIDAMLDYLLVRHRSSIDKEENVSWTSKRKTSGWIVPIATGFHGITPLGQAQFQRDPDTPHRFAEAVVTLGEFIMPYRVNNLDEMLWHYHTDPKNNLYLCQQNSRKHSLDNE